MDDLLQVAGRAEFYANSCHPSSMAAGGRGVKRRHFLLVGVVTIAAPVLGIWWSREERLLQRPDEPAGIQIVVQWFDNSPPNSSTRADPLLDLLYMRSDDLYVVDSFDLGGGAINVFLDADDPGPAVKRVIQLSEEGLLPMACASGWPRPKAAIRRAAATVPPNRPIWTISNCSMPARRSRKVAADTTGRLPA